MTDLYEISQKVQKYCILIKILMLFLPIMCPLGKIIDSNTCFEKKNRVVADMAGQAAGLKNQT